MKINFIWIVFALLLANFMGVLDATIVNMALPVKASELNGLAEVGLISANFLIGTAVSTIFWDKVSEYFCKKKLQQLAVTIFIIASMLADY